MFGVLYSSILWSLTNGVVAGVEEDRIELGEGLRVGGAKSDLYSVGVLRLEFWRNFTLSRGLQEPGRVGDSGLVER